ncbi:MAG: TolC family protein [Planctomycetota bacterium]|jgi:outer membrane protein TolC
MESFARRSVVAGTVAVVALGLVGCFPTREGVFRELHRSRIRAYTRWRENLQEEELLPRIGGELPLRDAISLGLAYSPGILNVVQEKEKARGRVWTAYGEALPTLEFSADYTRTDQVITVDLGVATFPIGDRDNYSYQVSLTQPLFKGGSIPAAIRGAKFFEYLSDETVRQVVQDVILNVAVAYYDVILAEHLYQVQVDALQFAQANLGDVTAREKAGVAIPFDRLRATVEVSNVEADLIQQRNRRNRARTALFRAMGVSQRSEVSLSDQMDYLAMAPQFEQAVLKAFTHRPELYRSELDVLLQQVALRVLRSDYFPELEAWGWHKWAKPDPHEASNIWWDKEWMAGVRLTWTLFDGLQREGNIIQQKATLRQSAINLADTEQMVLEEVKNAILNLADAAELVRSQRLNLERANEALRLVTLGAREGVNTELEVLDARAALTRARGLYYTALHAHVVSRLNLQRTLGMLGPEPGAREVPKEGPPPGIVEEFMVAASQEAPGPGEADSTVQAED